MIPLNEVPTEIFDEVKSEYPIIDLSEYLSTEVRSDWVTRKLSFQQKLSDDPITVTMMDPLSFEPTLVSGIPYEGFIIRGKFENDRAIIYQVVSAGRVLMN